MSGETILATMTVEEQLILASRAFKKTEHFAPSSTNIKQTGKLNVAIDETGLLGFLNKSGNFKR